MLCTLCPHNCQVDRLNKLGFCQAPADFKIAHIQLHHWEEPCISGTKGSGTIFFSHCNLKCVFCQNYKISQQGQGKLITANEFINLCLRLKKQGAHNINLVSPTCYSHLLIKVLPQVKVLTKLPIIWNSNAYEKVETLKQLNGLVDVYLPDFKYYDNELATKYSQINNYQLVASSAIQEMIRQVGEIKITDSGQIRKGVLIRHLVLPGRVNDSKQILQTIKNNFNNRVWVSLMSQYYPIYKSIKFPELSRTLQQNEYNEIKNFYDQLDFSGGYFQELNSASQNYTPNWQVETLDE